MRKVKKVFLLLTLLLSFTAVLPTSVGYAEVEERFLLAAQAKDEEGGAGRMAFAAVSGLAVGTGIAAVIHKMKK